MKEKTTLQSVWTATWSTSTSQVASLKTIGSSYKPTNSDGVAYLLTSHREKIIKYLSLFYILVVALVDFLTIGLVAFEVHPDFFTEISAALDPCSYHEFVGTKQLQTVDEEEFIGDFFFLSSSRIKMVKQDIKTVF